MTVTLSNPHRAARNNASITLADTGAGVATLKLYTSEAGTLLATRTLQKPCGELDPGKRIKLLQDAGATDLVTTSGTVTWAQWHDAGGNAILGCDVTDNDGAGPLKMPSTSVYAGGVLVLVDPVLIG